MSMMKFLCAANFAFALFQIMHPNSTFSGHASGAFVYSDHATRILFVIVAPLWLWLYWWEYKRENND